jgi:hypothetical protein
VLIAGSAGADDVVGVSYGGVGMTEVTGSPNVKGAAETGGTYVYFLGAGIPVGGQTVTLDVTGGDHLASAITLTAADDTTVVDTDATINSGAVANPSATLALAGRTCWCGEAVYSGQGAVSGIQELADWTNVQEFDIGTECGAVYRYNIVSNIDAIMGWSQSSDDAVCIGVAVSEVLPPGAATGVGWYGPVGWY